LAHRPAQAQAIVQAQAPEQHKGLVGSVLVLAALLMALFVAAPAQARGTPDGFADLAERLLPAVVNISSTQVVEERGLEMPQFPPGSPFDQLFRDFFDRQGKGDSGNDTPVQRRATSLGSGFIIDPAGYVVTNNHVIEDAEEITVILHDDTVLKAELIGRDPKVDVALLKVSAGHDLPYVSFADSDASRVGDWVMAIGNPFGLGGTVTAGIISAKTRDLNAGPYDSFIQTDASINRGNSGGPLFDMDGDVIGINTAIFSPSGGSVGIGFATPANLARQVLADLRKYGRARRGWLGVRIQTVTEEIAASLGLKGTSGALIASVSPDGPAEKGGIVAGDVVLEFNGQDIREMRRLPSIVAETEINAKVPVVVWRDGEKKTLKVVVGEMTDETDDGEPPKTKPSTSADDGSTSIKPLGMTVAPLTDALREQFSIPEDANGLVIMEILNDGPAAGQNVQPGDVITQVGRSQVKTAAEMLEQINKAKEAGHESVLLLIKNATSMYFITVPIKDKEKEKEKE
jgi:serine protease Do